VSSQFFKKTNIDSHGQARGITWVLESIQFAQREGEVPQALLGKGATCLCADTHRQTQAPVIDVEKFTCSVYKTNTYGNVW
jgi:hypothetical protein